ncbi:glycosyltransferase [Streptomyces sp. NPDC000983]|uniref:glycosyltransferase n=1 Tax=Streptomyces sp. NPDC000983 TaxID=3154373 RepID=UPI0033339258
MKVLLCPLSDPGYLYPAIAVGRELHRRGHHVTLLARHGAGATAAAAGLPLTAVEDDDGTGPLSVTCWFRHQTDQYRTILAEARLQQPDALLTSVLGHGALLAAETLDLPVVVLGLAAHLWPYAAGGEGEQERPARRQWRLHETIGFYNALREEAGFTPLPDPAAARALLGTRFLLRGDPLLEHPGARLPPGVHHVGPCLWEPDPDPEELGRLLHTPSGDRKPFAYVHLGRTFGGTGLWPRLNSAFTEGPLRAVVELGRSGPPAPHPQAALTTVRLPWMAPLVKHADLVITSATSAPVLTALTHGRPLLVAPAGSEQPLLAAACIRAGVARRLPEGATPDLLLEVLGDNSIRRAANGLAASLLAAGGAHQAADHVERAARHGTEHNEQPGPLRRHARRSAELLVGGDGDQKVATVRPDEASTPDRLVVRVDDGPVDQP